jgi:hypothetical protein
MPNLPKQPCSNPGCCALVEHGKSKCANHQRQQDAHRPTSTARGYGVRHRRLRIFCFQRDGWRCVDCGWEPNIVVDFRQFELGEAPTEQVLAELHDRFSRNERHLHADHEIPIRERPDLRLDLANLRTRCNSCHSAKTLRELLQNNRVGSHDTTTMSPARSSTSGPRVG